MIDLFLILTLAAHLLAMNVATAAPVVCVWLKRREVRQADEAAGRLGRFLAWQSTTSLLIGIALGFIAVALLWFGGHERFFQALAVVPRRRLWFGIVELVFYAALMLIYAWAWPRLQRARIWHPALALLAATDLIYHFPPLFAVIGLLQGGVSLPADELSYSGFLSLMLAPETIARVLHFLLASFAVTGALILYYATRLDGHPDRLMAWGGRLALAPSILQLLSGVYLLMSLPSAQQQRLMGGQVLATGLLAGSVMAALGLFHTLSTLALGEATPRDARRALLLMLLVVITMTAVRHFV